MYSFMKVYFLTLFILFCISTNLVNGFEKEGPVEIYVAMDGDDSHNGKINKPFKTIKAAIEQARKVRTNIEPYLPIEIRVREGVYRIYETMELDERDHFMSIVAHADEKVVISGSQSIDPSLLKLESGVYKVNLKDAGIVDFGHIRMIGFGRPYGIAWGEVFINDRSLHLARYPNVGTMAIDKVLDTGSIPRVGDFSNRGATFKFKNEKVRKWALEADPWIAGYFMWGYADDMIPVKDIDTVNNTITVENATMYGFGDNKKYRTWYGINLKSELDTVMEYYVDRTAGDLFFIFDEKPEKIEFSVLESPFFNIEHVENLVIRGITFENARGIGITSTETNNMLIEGCVFQNLGSVGVSMGRGVVSFENLKEEFGDIGRKGTIGNLQQHVYTNTIFDRLSGENNIIRHSVFRHLGAGGVTIGGGNRLTLEKGNNLIESCVFYDNNRIERSNRPAVHMMGVGNIVRNCEIFDSPGVAIFMNGNDHIIEYNYIHDVVKEADDMGAIYYGRDPSERGIVVRYNIIKDIPHKLLTAGIYHDDGACGLTAYSNIFVNAGQRNVLIGGGNDNKYYNNLFIGKEAGVFIDDRLKTWAKHLTVPDSGLYQKRLDVVRYKDAIYQLRYPTLKTYFETIPKPANNLFHRNVFLNFKKPVFAKKKSQSWRRMALGFSNYNVIDKSKVIKRGDTLFNILNILNNFSSILEPVPVHVIGLKKNIFFPTEKIELGIENAFYQD